MKLIFIILFSLSIISCGGLSEKEKQNIIDTTCAVLKETDESQGAFRVKELNLARNNLDEEVFTGGDEVAYDAIKFGLCESLVSNDKSFDIKLAAAQNKYREEFIVSSCEELNVSYVPIESSYEHKESYQYDMMIGGIDDEEFIAEVNTKKLKQLNQYMLELDLPPFRDGVDELITIQFLGLCENLLQGDTQFVKQRLNSYRKLKEISKEEKNEFKINLNTNFTNDNGDVYFRKYLEPKEPDFTPYQSFINIDDLTEYSDIEFNGVSKQINIEEQYFSSFNMVFTHKNNTYQNDIITTYKNGNKYIITNTIDGMFSVNKNWFYNGGLFISRKFKNNKTISSETYQPDGRLSHTFRTIDNKYRLYTDYSWDGEIKKTCKNNENDSVDMKFCQ
jgi:hypothetical protein